MRKMRITTSIASPIVSTKTIGDSLDDYKKYLKEKPGRPPEFDEPEPEKFLSSFEKVTGNHVEYANDVIRYFTTHGFNNEHAVELYKQLALLMRLEAHDSDFKISNAAVIARDKNHKANIEKYKQRLVKEEKRQQRDLQSYSNLEKCFEKHWNMVINEVENLVKESAMVSDMNENDQFMIQEFSKIGLIIIEQDVVKSFDRKAAETLPRSIAVACVEHWRNNYLISRNTALLQEEFNRHWSSMTESDLTPEGTKSHSEILAERLEDKLMSQIRLGSVKTTVLGSDD